LGTSESKHLSRSHYRICRGKHSYLNSYNVRPMRNPSLTDLNQFTLNLVELSGKVLNFLNEVQKLPGFENEENAEKNMKNYLCFLMVQEENPSEALLPPMQTQAVWFSHMLQSCSYKTFTQNFTNIWNLNHPVSRTLESQERQALEARTQKLIEERYPPCSDLMSNASFVDLWKSLVGQFTPAMVIHDRDWTLEFNKFTSGTDVNSVEFREKAHFGYRRLLYLKSRYSDQVEAIGFSPCPSIDLVWHTHLVHPSTYETDMNKVLGHVPMHKLLDVPDRTEAFMDSRDDKSMEMWQNEFQESIFVYAVV